MDINIVGSIASIAGAILAIGAALKAKSSMDQAQAIRDSISNDQKKIFISKLLTETKKAMAVSIKMTTPASPTMKLRGLDYQSSIEQLREYIDTLKENAHYLKTENKREVERAYKFIESRLSVLANETDQQRKYEIGDKIHNSMGEILKGIKPELDI